MFWRCSFPRFSISTWALQWLSGKENACKVEDAGSIPGSGRSPGGPSPANPMDRGAWQVTVHGVTKSRTQLSNWAHTHRHRHHGNRAGALMPRAEGFQLRVLTTLLKGSISLMHHASLKDWQVSESIWFQAGWYSVTYHHAAAAAAKLLQSCPTLCDPIDGSPPGSPSLRVSRQEHWSGLIFPPPMHESEKWKWSHSVVSNS